MSFGGDLTIRWWAVILSLTVGLSAAGQSPDKPTGPTPTCATASCHTDIVGRPFMHDPANRRRCLDCHEYAVAEKHLFRLTAPRSELCGNCHSLQLRRVVHAPVTEGNCTGCHDPHGSEHPGLLLAGLTGGLCTSCHKEDIADKAFVHGPVAVGACVICHDPHSSPHEGLLPTTPSLLCLECHADSAPSGLAARHVHKPMEQGCTTCHDAHASDVRYQLHQSIPTLCLTCHQGVKSLIQSAPVVHNLLGESQGCESCHDPHFTQLPYLQRKTQPQLCLDCHNQAIRATDGRLLADMAKLLRDNPNHHGPIRDGACTACHHPHAAEHFRLLFKEYPADFYAPFEPDRYALCFSCHLPDLVQDQSGVGLTGFRNGDLNLHWLHVNQEKGRTCRACHEVHASTRPFHIREAVPYGSGGWMLEINYEQNINGGSCAPACHKARTYDRALPAESTGIAADAPASKESP